MKHRLVLVALVGVLALAIPIGSLAYSPLNQEMEVEVEPLTIPSEE